VDVDFGTTTAALKPTDERIKASPTTDDPALAALYYQYGRYLLIACSRPGGQAANLQGVWNDKTFAPWGSKYTININTEMNYWPAEPTGSGRTASSRWSPWSATWLGHRRPDRQGDVRRPRLGRAPQHRPLAGHRTRSTARSMASGRRAGPGSASTCGTTTTTAAIAPIWPTSIR
jgi:hypothetical protein